jgi:hypothetical protein
VDTVKRSLREIGDTPAWLLVAAFVTVTQAAPWLQWATEGKLSAVGIGFSALSVAIALGFAIWFIPRVKFWQALVFALNSLLSLVITFAGVYVSHGSDRDWSLSLTRLDSLTVSLGNLSTAGTGGINPRSELARRLITMQYGLDLVAVLIVAGLLVARIANRPR